MASRGSVLKQEITNKILSMFPESFLYNDGKEIRINGIEDGNQLQIKVTLTCAKVAVENGNNVTLSDKKDINTTSENFYEAEEKIPQEPSAEEKERLTNLLNKLGL